MRHLVKGQGQMASEKANVAVKVSVRQSRWARKGVNRETTIGTKRTCRLPLDRLKGKSRTINSPIRL